LGILAYAVAKADGHIPREERQMIHDIVVKESEHNIDFDYTEIIFSTLQRDKPGIEQVYDRAMNAFETRKQHFTVHLKEKFIIVIQKLRILSSIPLVHLNEPTYHRNKWGLGDTSNDNLAILLL
jgi:hypothetical protein